MQSYCNLGFCQHNCFPLAEASTILIGIFSGYENGVTKGTHLYRFSETHFLNDQSISFRLLLTDCKRGDVLLTFRGSPGTAPVNIISIGNTKIKNEWKIPGSFSLLNIHV